MKSLWEAKLSDMKQELASIKNRAVTVTGKTELLIRELESLKPDIIKKCLEDQRRILARQRGISAFAGDERAKRLGFGIGILSAVFGGLLSKDPIIALNAGMSGFDGLVCELGETKWYVTLSDKISVVPQGEINVKGNRVSWEDVMSDLESMKKHALAGERLGSLNDIVIVIRHGKILR